MTMLDLMNLSRGRTAVAAPTGMIVLVAVGMAMMDAGDAMDAKARAHGEAVNHELSTMGTMATYGAAGVGLLVLLAGGGVALSMLRDEDGGDDELPVHRGGSPSAPRGIDITPGGD